MHQRKREFNSPPPASSGLQVAVQEDVNHAVPTKDIVFVFEVVVNTTYCPFSIFSDVAQAGAVEALLAGELVGYLH
jgi:hypothetical protein